MPAHRHSGLRLVSADPAPRVLVPSVDFCGACGERPDGPVGHPPICQHCEMGLVLRAPGDVAPEPGDAFLIVDPDLRIASVSAATAARLAIHPDHAIGRPLSELVEPADGSGPRALTETLIRVATSGEVERLVLRQPGEFGSRLRARAGGCERPLASVIVFAGRRRAQGQGPGLRAC